MNPNMMNRNMNYYNRCGMNQRDMSCSNKGCAESNTDCTCNTPAMNNDGCGCHATMPDNDYGTMRSSATNSEHGCMNQQQLMNMNKKQLLQYLNQVSFSMFDTVLFLDTHQTDQQALAHFKEMREARTEALKIYQQKFGPLLLDHADADCEWTWGMEPLPWENCEY